MITLRAATATDIPAINRIYNQESVRRFTLGLPYTSIASSRRHLGKDAAWQTRLVACNALGEVVGEALLARAAAPRRAHVGAVGLIVAQEARRRGIGRALLAALLDLADDWLGLHRLELTVFANNTAAIALYRSMGFETEVTERHAAMQDGVLADCLLMARLRPGLAGDSSAPPPRPALAPRQPFTLRAVEPEDLPAITTLMNLPGVRHGTLALPFQAEETRRHLAEPQDGEHGIAAIAAGMAVGLAVLKPGKGRRLHTAYISALLVHDEFQGQGIGRALLAALLDITDNWLGLSRVALGVLADNRPAIRLYESFGFAVEGRMRADVFRNGAHADALAMARLR